MKPFLLLQSRGESETLDDELRAICEFSGLARYEIVCLNLTEAMKPSMRLEDYSGVIMAGGPANYAYDESEKTPEQRAMELQVCSLLEEAVAADMPFLGICLGMSALLDSQDCKPDFAYAEQISAPAVSLTAAGRSDKLFTHLPERFQAVEGHKEGVKAVPAPFMTLAEDDVCVQAVRLKQNLYGVQFHPELDAHGLRTRLVVYSGAGYCAPEEEEAAIAVIDWQAVAQSRLVLRRFTEYYGRRRATLDYLRRQGIRYRLEEHLAVYTVAESTKAIPEKTPVKTLLVTDAARERIWMIIVPGETRLDMKRLAVQCGVKKMQFVRPERVQEIVGVQPGSVSLFGLLHPGSSGVSVLIEQSLAQEPELGFHPNDNTATVYIKPSAMFEIIASTGHTYASITQGGLAATDISERNQT